MSIFEINQPSDLVRHYRHRAKKHFGQHFLVDPSILTRLVEAAGVEPGDRVLEIGPGCGTLTWTLLKFGAKVTAIEIDEDSVDFLRNIANLDGELEIVQEDALEVDVEELCRRHEGRWRCVSNLPYNVATEILFHLAPSFDRFDALVLMFQREVAQRLVARAGDESFGRLSLMAQLYADIEVVQTLAPGAFIPHPKVFSAAVRLDPIPGTRVKNAEIREAFDQIVRAAFQARRKILPNALASTGVEKEKLEAAIEAVNLSRTDRPERVAFESWVELARKLAPLLDRD